MLDLDFSPEQQLLATTTRDVLARHCPLEVVRQMEDDPIGYPADLWRQLGELDLVGLLLPEPYGGSSMTLLEGVALYQELGRALAPTPHFLSAVMCGGALALAGSEEQKERWLPQVASGEAVLTPAWLEPGGAFSPLGVQLRAEASSGGFTLSGTKRHVTFAKAADRLVVLARTGDGPTDVDLFLVDPSTEGVSLTQQFSIASDSPVRRGARVGPRRRSRADRRRRGRAGPPGPRCSSPGWSSWPLRPSAAPARRSTSRSSTPRTADSSTSRSGPSRPSPTTCPTR